MDHFQTSLRVTYQCWNWAVETGVTDIIELLAWLKWNSVGHVARMKYELRTKKSREWRPRADKRIRRRSPTRWTDIRRIAGNWLQAQVQLENLGETYFHLWLYRAVWWYWSRNSLHCKKKKIEYVKLNESKSWVLVQMK